MKKLFSLLLALAMVLALSACNTPQDTSSTESTEETPTATETPQATGDVVEIRFASWDNADDLDAQQALVDEFNESQDGIRVILEGYGDDFDTKIAASMGASDAPDVMYMWNYPAYYEGLEPLDSYISAEGADFKENYYDALWAYNSIDGTVYGMPVGYTTHVLYYNMDMFDEAGLDYPTDEWTFDDVYAAAKAITEYYDDGSTKGYIFPIEYDPYDFEMYLWTNGTALVSPEGTLDGYLNSDASVEAFTWFQNIVKDGYGVAAEDYGTSAMVSQNVAMYINGSWPISQLNEAGFNWGVVKLPSFQSGESSVSILSSSGLAMSASSANKEAAWEFIKFWTGEEANLSRIDYELPVLKSVVASQNLESDPIKSVFYAMLEQSEGYTPASFIVSNWSVLYDEITLAMEQMFNPTSLMDPSQVLNGLV